MLNGQLVLHDIQDVERYCGEILRHNRDRLEAAFAKAGRQFNHQDAETYIAWLIEACWEYSTRTPQPWRTSFSGWVGRKLRHHATVEYLRFELKRSTWRFSNRVYERPRPRFVPFDRELGGVEHRIPVDGEAGGGEDLVRLLGPGDREGAWGDGAGGAGVDGRPSGRDRTAA